MTKNSDIAILILAAGESTRMGEPKQLLPWKGTTLLGYAINEAKLVSTENIYVVLGGNYELIKNIEELETVNSIYNPDYKIGQGTSLSCGINYILKKEDVYKAILIMLCDQPLITSEYLKGLITTYYINNKGIVATNYENRAGVPVIFSADYFEELSSIKGDIGAKSILRNNIKELLLINANGKELDVDTKKEYNELINQLKF